MVLFFRAESNLIYAVGAARSFSNDDILKLSWLFNKAKPIHDKSLNGYFIGPRKEMITPWSTNAVEITQTMGLTGIERMEEFCCVPDAGAKHDPMLQRLYAGLDQDI